MNGQDSLFPPSIRAVLDAVAKYRPVVVGGYLRDRFHGVPFKDVDVFFCEPEAADNAVADILFLFRLNSVPTTRTILGGSAELGEDRNIAGIDEVVFKGITFQFIYPVAPTDPHTLINSVDFDICRIGWSFETGLVITDGYQRDSALRTFTLLPVNQKRTDRALARYERLREKYPGFVLARPDEAISA